MFNLFDIRSSFCGCGEGELRPSLFFSIIQFHQCSELDLTRQSHVELFFEKERPQYVFLAAAKVGGILANCAARTTNFDLETSPVLPALIRKFYEAHEKWNASSESERDEICVTIWGTGSPLREFLHVDDMAEGCIFTINHVSSAALYESGISHFFVFELMNRDEHRKTVH